MQPIYRSSDRVWSRSQHPVVGVGSLLGAASTLLAVAVLTLVASRSVALASKAGLVDRAAKASAHGAAVTLAPTGAALRTPAGDDAPSQYGVSVGIVGYGGVNLTPSGPYASDTVVTAAADPSPGYRFEAWSGAYNGAENPFTFTIDSDVVLTATFVLDVEPRTYAITASALGGGVVGVDPSGPFAPGETATLTAYPNAGWRFARWSGEINGSSNPLALTVIDDTDVVAIFEMESAPPTLTLTIGNDGEGLVTVDPPGPFAPGQMVTITAVPASGWSFQSWSGHLAGNANPYVMTILTHTTAIARFQRETEEMAPLLNIETHGSGSVILEPAGPYQIGQLVRLRALPEPGWRFEHWSGALAGDTNPTSFALLGDTRVAAHFSPLPATPVTLTVHITGSGQVQRDPPGPYTAGQAVKITAVPAPGWHFTGWSGDLAGTANPLTFAIVENLTVYSAFAPNPPPDDPPDPPPDDPVGDPAPDPPDNPPVDEPPEPVPAPAVEVHVAGAGTVERDPPGPYAPGQLITLTAQAETGWAFAGWSGSLNGHQNPHAATVTATLEVTATFVLVDPTITYQVVVETRGAGAVQIFPSGPYTQGQKVTLTALPEPGQCLQSWAGSLAGVANPQLVAVTEDLAVTAQFGPCPVYLPLIRGRN